MRLVGRAQSAPCADDERGVQARGPARRRPTTWWTRIAGRPRDSWRVHGLGGGPAGNRHAEHCARHGAWPQPDLSSAQARSSPARSGPVASLSGWTRSRPEPFRPAGSATAPQPEWIPAGRSADWAPIHAAERAFRLWARSASRPWLCRRRSHCHEQPHRHGLPTAWRCYGHALSEQLGQQGVRPSRCSPLDSTQAPHGSLRWPEAQPGARAPKPGDRSKPACRARDAQRRSRFRAAPARSSTTRRRRPASACAYVSSVSARRCPPPSRAFSRPGLFRPGRAPTLHRASDRWRTPPLSLRTRRSAALSRGCTRLPGASQARATC